MPRHVLFIASPVAVALAFFAACATDNGDNVHGVQYGPTPTRDGGEAGPFPEEEGGPTSDAGDAATKDGSDATSPCTSGTVAVLAGRGTPTPSLSGSIQDKGGAWTGSAIAGGAAESTLALVAFGSGFLGVTHGAADTLLSTTYATSWSAPASFGVAGVKVGPTLAIVGTKAHVVYTAGAGASSDFYHGVNGGSGWDAANDPVGSPPSFGAFPAGLAAAGTELGFAQAGTNNGLYYQSWSGAWSMYKGPDTIDGVDGAGAAEAASPALATVDGKFDVVLAYANKDGLNKIRWVARDATTKIFTAPEDVNGSNTTYASTLEPIALTRVGTFTLLLTFRGNDGKGYYASGTLGATTITWSSPAPLATGGVAVDTTPRAAKGVCGDDAVIAFASSGAVKVVRLRGSTLTAPETVLGAAGTRVAIATR